MKVFFKKNIFLITIILSVILGLFLRLYNLWDNIYFGFDQARDFQRIENIIRFGNVKLLGPETYISGLFNSPLYYYALAPIYYLTQGNPNWSVIFLALINLSVGFFLYKLALALFDNRWVGGIAVFLLSISFEQVNFARHLSQAPLAILFTAVFYLGLAQFFLHNKRSGVALSVVGLALAVHSNIYFIYLIFLYPLLYAIYRPKYTVKNIFLNCVLLCILLSSFILAEIKFQFNGIKALLMFMGGKQGAALIVTDNISNYVQKMTEAVVYSFFSFNFLWAFLLLIAFIFLIYRYGKTQRITFLMIIMLSTLPLFSYKSSILESTMINTSIYIPLTIVVAGAVFFLLQKKSFAALGGGILILIIFSNTLLFVRDGFIGMKRIAYQNLPYGDEKKAIDYTYNSSGKKQFSICAITNPLFVNTLWSYLFHSYGRQMYGYVPSWSGQKQDYIESLIPMDTEKASTRYLIIEPMIGIPEIAKQTSIYLEDQISVLEEERQIGDITIQKRRLEPDSSQRRDTQGLSQGETTSITATQQSDPRYSCFQY